MITKKSTVFFVFFTCAICTWLFYLKYSVIDIEDRIRRAKKSIIEEKKNQHILRAEWKSLTSPERIQSLARRHLNLQQMEASQLQEFDPGLFHSEKVKYKRTKRLSKLVNEILSQQKSSKDARKFENEFGDCESVDQKAAKTIEEKYTESVEEN